jgi:hypothetical protein
LEHKIGKELADQFYQGNEGRWKNLYRFCERFGVESKFLRKYNKIMNPSGPVNFG